MDRFKIEIKSQIFPLSSLDCHPSYCNIPSYLYYENKNSDKNFMPSGLLRDSFYTVLQYFPFLAGHLHMDNGGIGAYIEVDKHNLNLPGYCESDSNVHFSDVKRAKFCWSELPDQLRQIHYFTSKTNDGNIRLANVKIARLRDNSGLIIFITVTHAVMDGYGFGVFMNHWAHIYRGLTRKGDLSIPEDSESLALHERRLLYSCLPDQGMSLDPFTDRALNTKSIMSAGLAWLSPGARGAFLNTAARFIKTKSHMFYLPYALLDPIKKSASVTGQTIESRISDNDIITAMLCMVFRQSCGSKASSVLNRLAFMLTGNSYYSGCDQDEYFMAAIAVDCRHRLKVPELYRYSGNCIIPFLGIFPLNDIYTNMSNDSISKCALHVRNSTNNVTPHYIREYMDALEAEPDSFLRTMAAMAMVPTCFCVSNLSRVGNASMDFGNGHPAWINPPQAYVPGYALILPRNKSDDGYHIFLSLTTGDMDKVLEHPFWKDAADFIY